MYPVSSDGLNKETKDAVYFFTPAFYPLDNFSAHAVNIWGRIFPTAEHAFQWKKFFEIEPDIAERIFTAGSPHAVKKISEANKTKIPEDWKNLRVEVMEQILKAKVSQHEDVGDALIRTGKRTIVENSPVDSFWGIGPNQKGENMVGKIFMKIRDNR